MLLSATAVCLSLFVHSAANPVQAHRENGDYLSPDGKYIAHVASDQGSTGLWIYRAAPNHKRIPHSKPVLNDVDCVDGIVWVPGRSHTLVLATSSIYGTAALGLWSRGSHFRPLVKVRYPGAESFQLSAVSRDGHAITYLHGLNEKQTEDQYRKCSLTLPDP